MHHILVVEDDYLQRDWICLHLRRVFQDANIEEIATELEFHTKLDQIATNPPDIIIMDVILPWTSPSPNLQEPPDQVKSEGNSSAGLRCRKMLEVREETRNIPVLLYTVLTPGDLHDHIGDQAGNVMLLQKDPDPALLVQRIRAFLEPMQVRETTN